MRLLKLNNSLGLEEQKWDLDWSNTSEKWTPELRAYVGASQFDDDENSQFFIHLIDLCNKFTRTSLFQCDFDAPLIHSQLLHSFLRHEEDEYMAFFKFTLSQPIN